jgi:hypothetical protein
MAMRKIAGILVVTAAIGFSAAPLVRAQSTNDSSTSSQQGQLQQHQEAVPSSPAQKDQKDSDQSKRDQSAAAPQSPAVITPPTTGDKSVITPPATGASKMPVIKPPGSTGNKDDEIQPK